MRILAVLLLLHAAISGGQVSMGFKPGPGIANPAWLSWWPTNLGQSWLLQQLGVTSRAVYALTGVLWLAATIGFAVAGIMLLISPARPGWAPVAAGSAIISLVALGIYVHPWYVGAFALNIALLAGAAVLGRVQ
ncbi:MAG TPA: hypothetical protein VD969_23485 [Symbiobacteriaceae bacterium]|nr:hypothetical protein [Symbiobacteriaceae bacterium]